MREISLIFYSDILPKQSYSSHLNQHQWQKRGKVTPAATPYSIALVPEPGHIMKQTHINKRCVLQIYRNIQKLYTAKYFNYIMWFYYQISANLALT